VSNTDATRELDPTVAVVVDSRRSEHRLARATILPARVHWGVPHAVLDLADGPVAPRLGRAGVVLVAQEYLGEPLDADLAAIVEHARAGAEGGKTEVGGDVAVPLAGGTGHFGGRLCKRRTHVLEVKYFASRALRGRGSGRRCS